MGFFFTSIAAGVNNNNTKNMLKKPSAKYRAFSPVRLPNRKWPNRVLKQAPRWCSVDLRDGNQALAVPMNVSQKLELFQTLFKCVFNEI